MSVFGSAFNLDLSYTFQFTASSEGVQESDALSLNMSEIEVARGNPNQFNLFIENCFVDPYMCQGLTGMHWLIFSHFVATHRTLYGATRKAQKQYLA